MKTIIVNNEKDAAEKLLIATGIIMRMRKYKHLLDLGYSDAHRLKLQQAEDDADSFIASLTIKDEAATWNINQQTVNDKP